MKIRITFDLGPDERESIAHYYREEGLADYKVCRDHIYAAVAADLEQIGHDLQEWDTAQELMEKEANEQRTASVRQRV